MNRQIKKRGISIQQLTKPYARFQLPIANLHVLAEASLAIVDVNKDGVVDIGDATFIQMKSAGKNVF